MTVDPEDDHLLALARAIDEETPIDWHAAEDSVPGDVAKAVLSELRVLHGLARVARDPDSATTTPTPVSGPGKGGPQEPAGSWGALTVFEEIGRGAFSRVYRARDSLGRDVALKVFRDPTDSARLLDEGRRLTRVRHPNVVVVHGATEVDGQVGLWMELIRGRTLEDELKTRGAFSAEEARLIGLDLCRALAAVHEAGLVHRDVKAQNVMREQGGRIVLMDFGAGTEAEAGDPSDVAGTPMYLAPEVFDGQPASRLSDIYSLGVLLYHLVTGSYPVSGSSRFEIQRAHSERRIKRLRDARPDLPEGFVQLVEAALAEPGRRYQTAGELEHALSSGSPVPVPAAAAKPLAPHRPCNGLGTGHRFDCSRGQEVVLP
jgi:serine/threonine-protein kinase